jgi:hypothetical protein
MAIPRVTEGDYVRRYKQGDRLPVLEYVALEDEDGQAANLTGATAAVFVFRKRTSAAATAVSAAATIVNAETGELRYDWAAGDLASAGNYYGEFRVTIGGVDRTFPQRGYIPFVVESDLNT